MKTLVQFRSDKFPAYIYEEEEIKPGLWGSRLADYLAANLRKKGIKAGEPVAKDWGFCIPIDNNEFPLSICCGHRNGDDDEFLCFTDPATPTIRKLLFWKIDATPRLEEVTRAMDEILTSDPAIREIEWMKPF
ncbi:hypothetical protein [Luteolibacter sp. AS25]|uniref:hypothetical protein n=1 Tax=Luteolibacter sp. AS25 TaxID=3135776 RepID=UPI00398BA353